MIAFPEIELEDVTVDYLALGWGGGRARSKIPAAAAWGAAPVLDSRGKLKALRAIDGISLRASAGDSVGLIGRNGSGKTTLLKVLGGLLPPTSGKVTMIGSRSSLISMQAGLSNHLSGRENIVLRGLLMGLNRAAINLEVDAIIDFTELGEFIDFPLHSYSAGMRFRLAFAVVTAFPADVVLLDEWIATGDKTFKLKVEQRLRSFLDTAGVLFFASHSEELVDSICNRKIFLERGKIVEEGW